MRRSFTPLRIRNPAANWLACAIDAPLIGGLQTILAQIDLPEPFQAPQLRLPKIIFASSQNHWHLSCGLLNTAQRVEDLMKLLKNVESCFELSDVNLERLCAVQSAIGDKDSMTMRLQRYLLLRNPEMGNHPVAHLCISTDNFFAKPDELSFDPLLIKTMNRLEHLQNIEGLLQYCSWINEEFQKNLRSIALGATDRFALEGTIRNFEHQVHSTLLQNCWSELKQLLLTLGEEEFGGTPSEGKLAEKEIVRKEKAAMELRIDMRSYLQSHEEVLGDLILQLSKIEDPALKLQNITAIAIVAQVVLALQIDLSGSLKASLGQQLLLLALLNALLGVVPIFNSQDDTDRAPLCSAVSMALIQLLADEGAAAVTLLTINWDSSCKEVNKEMIRRGYQDFTAWLKRAPPSSLQIAARLTQKLRKFFINNLYSIGTKTTLAIPERPLRPRQCYLDFLPGNFVLYDPDTGSPLRLKTEAEEPLLRCFTPLNS